MAITTIQDGPGTWGSSTQPSITWINPPTAGNLMVALISWNIEAGDATISNIPAGWQQAQAVVSSGYLRQAMFYKVAGASEPTSVQWYLSASRYWEMAASEMHSTSGSAWVVDKVASATGTTAFPVSGTTATTTSTEEFWAAGICCNVNLTLGSPTNSFTVRQEIRQATLTQTFLTRIAAVTGAASTGGIYGSSVRYAGLIVTYMVQVQTVTAAGASLSGRGTLTGRGTYPTPTLAILAAFGYGASHRYPVWTLITSYVRTFTWQRGKQNELNQLTAGTATLVLNDPNSHFDPSNTASPFYPNVKPGLPVRAYLFVGDAAYQLFYGFAERLPRTQRVTTVYTQRQIDLVDGFTQLAYAGLAGDSYPQQTADQRITQVLDNVQWPDTRRRIGTATTTLQAIVFPGEDDTRAQQHLQAVDDSEAGLLYVDGGNTLVFVGRSALSQPPYTTSQATYADAAGAAGTFVIGSSHLDNPDAAFWSGVLSYTELVPSYDLDQVFNRWTVTRQDGSPQTAEDTASQTAYFLRAKQTETLLSDDAQALALAQLKLSRFAQPLNRVESLTVRPLTNLADTFQIAAGFARDLGDRITIQETPPGFGSVQSHDYTIEQINGHIDVGPLVTATLTFNVWLAP
jgi:hypothetical protein